MNDANGFLGAGAGDEACYEWGDVFASPWPARVEAMGAKAVASGFDQRIADGVLVWMQAGAVKVRFLFVDDPSDIGAIRDIYSDDANIAAPASFVIVKQPDPTDDRGDIIFDIFLMSARSYLWHFNRVFTRPTEPHAGGGGWVLRGG